MKNKKTIEKRFRRYNSNWKQDIYSSLYFQIYLWLFDDQFLER